MIEIIHNYDYEDFGSYVSYGYMKRIILDSMTKNIITKEGGQSLLEELGL